MLVILLTGGIGDFMAVESHMSDQERQDLTAVIYATRAHRPIRQIMGCVPAFPNLRHHITLLDKWSKFFCYHTRHEVLQTFFRDILPFRECPQEVVRLLGYLKDFSIGEYFQQILSTRFYTGSSFLKYPCVNNFANFNLPPRYFTIHPYTPNDRRIATREFDAGDWAETTRILEARDAVGVVLGTDQDFVPDHPRFLNFQGRTTLPESIEVLKNSQGFIGIDSCLSVLAAKLFHYPDLLVKCHNDHGYNNKAIYFAPKADFQFLVRDFRSCP